MHDKVRIIWFSDWTILMSETGEILASDHSLRPSDVLRALGIEVKHLDASSNDDSETTWYDLFNQTSNEERLKMFDELWSIGNG